MCLLMCSVWELRVEDGWFVQVKYAIPIPRFSTKWFPYYKEDIWTWCSTSA